MTRKHFRVLAAEIAKIKNKDSRASAAMAAARACAQFNPDFVYTTFFAACKVV